MDTVSFLQDRISRAYQEQMWAVSLLGAFYGFMITKGNAIPGKVKPGLLRTGVWISSVLGVAFILSRHVIFAYYDRRLKEELTRAGGINLLQMTALENIGEFMVSLSGVILYSLIVAVLAYVALKTIRTGKDTSA